MKPSVATPARPVTRATLALLSTLFLACSTTSALSPPLAAGGIKLGSEIEFDSSDPQASLELVPKHQNVELEEADEDIVARYRLTDGHIEVQTASGAIAGYIGPLEQNEPGFAILKQPGGPALYRLRLEPDGDLKLQDANGQVLYKLKRRDYGLKVVRANDELESRVRIKGEKTSVRNADGETVFSTRDPLPLATAACLSLVDFPLEFGAGLGLAIIHWGNPSESES